MLIVENSKTVSSTVFLYFNFLTFYYLQKRRLIEQQREYHKYRTFKIHTFKCHTVLLNVNLNWLRLD